MRLKIVGIKFLQCLVLAAPQTNTRIDLFGRTARDQKFNPTLELIEACFSRALGRKALNFPLFTTFEYNDLNQVCQKKDLKNLLAYFELKGSRNEITYCSWI